jgi:hypothetical protein
MAVRAIEDPVALAQVDWIPESDGGRPGGPPPATVVYATTCVFELGGEEEDQPGWPWTADLVLSILIQETSRPRPDQSLAMIDFLVPDLAEPYVRVGNRILVTEGPRIVAHATITEVLSHRDASGAC